MTETSAGPAPTESRLHERITAWRGRAFSPASELPGDGFGDVVAKASRQEDVHDYADDHEIRSEASVPPVPEPAPPG
jgi:hypothetical protein